MRATDEVATADCRYMDCVARQAAFRGPANITGSAIVRKTPVSCHAFGVIFPEEGASSFLTELLNCAL